jgi:hypothetical protein
MEGIGWNGWPVTTVTKLDVPFDAPPKSLAGQE